MKEKKPLVSILTSCYNGSKFIEQYGECLLSQTYRPLECIIVNDGSEDDSARKLEELSIKVKNTDIALTIVHQNNMGLAGGISTAFSHSKGEYLICWDIDDIFSSDNVETLANLLIDNPEAGAALANGYHVDDTNPGILLQSFSERHSNFCPEKNIFEQLICAKAWNWAGCYIARADILTALYGGRRIPIPQAWKNAQNLQLLLPSAKMGCVYTPTHIMKYVRNTSSLINKDTSYERQIRLLNIFQDIRRELLEILGEIKYVHMLNEHYTEARLMLAYTHNNLQDFNHEYAALQGQVSIEKRLFHAIINHKHWLKVLFLRLLNKGSKLIR